MRKTPSSNLQTPMKHQRSNVKKVGHVGFEVWKLENSLELGAWNWELFPDANT
jgi:hypothetical protein